MATIEQVAELKQKTIEGRAALLTAARSLRPADALRVPVDATGEEQWTALEQLAHLHEMERNYVAWVRAILDEDGVDLAGVPAQPVPVPVEDANAATIAIMVGNLEEERAKTLALIDSLGLDAFDRTGVSPLFGRLTVLQWLRSFYRHDRQHLAQIEGRRSDYQPNFQGTEPNQRLMRLERVAREQEQSR